jgi:gas vesicle protein
MPSLIVLLATGVIIASMNSQINVAKETGTELHIAKNIVEQHQEEVKQTEEKIKEHENSIMDWIKQNIIQPVENTLSDIIKGF